MLGAPAISLIVPHVDAMVKFAAWKPALSCQATTAMATFAPKGRLMGCIAVKNETALGRVWESEIVPILEAAPGIRAVAFFERFAVGSSFDVSAGAILEWKSEAAEGSQRLRLCRARHSCVCVTRPARFLVFGP